jgi:hypothetical protein
MPRLVPPTAVARDSYLAGEAAMAAEERAGPEFLEDAVAVPNGTVSYLRIEERELELGGLN